jgi:tRNA dimethylallyltransferase
LPHKLYGHVPPDKAYSVADWLVDVGDKLDEAYEQTKLPIFVGGTGLYFKALIEGFAQIPNVGEEVRKLWRDKAEEKTAEELHKILHQRDHLAAHQIKSNDTQRILRALEVWDATGRSIIEWQNENSAPLIDKDMAKKIVLMPKRDVLYDRINVRFAQMFDSGAIEEVENLLKLELDPQLSVMKAIGVPQIAAYLQGDMDKQQAIDKASQATRNYAKRQMTWFRNQLDDSWKQVDSIPFN